MASGASKFKFISPGIFINEVDESKLPADPGVDPGPTIIGRTRMGPGLTPTVIDSYDDFVQVFGAPDPGAENGDNWRNNDFDGPTYGGYAAQAWLRSQQSPINFVRLLGAEDPLRDGSTAGNAAGWITDKSTFSADKEQNGAAYGLFLIDTGSVSGSAFPTAHGQGPFPNARTGSLAAVWYLQSGGIGLSGSFMNSNTAQTASAATLMRSEGASNQFRATIFDNAGAVVEETCFNFDPNSDLYIRKVFNTNAAQTNSDLVSTGSPSYYTYWLGETYDQFLNSRVSGSGDGATLGVILAMESSSVAGLSVNKADMNSPYVNAETPYIFAQTEEGSNKFVEANQQELFKFVSLEQGESAHRHKISIANISAAPYPALDPYGTFSVLVRASSDRDAAPEIIERFDECNLNPLSPNYIGKKIGDMYKTWDSTEGRWRYYGTYPNLSNYFRVVINAQVEAGAASIASLLPAGYLGPLRYKGFSFGSGSLEFGSFDASGSTGPDGAGFPEQKATPLATGSNAIGFGPCLSAGSNAIGPADTRIQVMCENATVAGGNTGAFFGRFQFPTFHTRVSASDGGLNVETAYFGIQTNKTDLTATTPTGSMIFIDQFDPSYYDICRPMPFGPNGNLSSFSNTGQNLERGFVFSLDNVVSASTGWYYQSGSHVKNEAYTSATANSFRSLLEAGIDKFTVPVHGGFDGLDISEREPFRNSQWNDTSTSRTSYSLATLQRSIKAVSDPERVVTNLITVPGVWRKQVTDDVISTCENRGDALALIDIEDAGTPPATEGTALSTPEQRRPSVTGSVTKLRAREINSSYACTYFPWVHIVDPGTGATIEMPPSVAALGTFASSQARTELWFAPAGFVRGGLSNGAAGLPVTGVSYRLTAKERDTLYAANINPIAQFPNEGIVIFGQKTLQITRSALDRINVRRLMIFIKKEISKMAATVLFDPNVSVTWSRFTSKVNPFLGSVKARFGLSEFKVVLDKTTTTDDLVDRNIMYAKIYLKPTKAIEFIALDFIITRQGASFDD